MGELKKLAALIPKMSGQLDTMQTQLNETNTIIKSMDTKVKKLEEKVIKLETIVDRLETEKRKTSILIFGIEQSETKKSSISEAREFLTNHLDLPELQVMSAFRFKTTDEDKPPALYVQLFNRQDVFSVLSNGNKLREKDFTVSENLTKE